ncbi:MAG TPA: glycoside hydrolase family 2 TIM barrel-domain containing protein [Candidatus Hydrogenedentes bacterium]|nr:glycoside hydrolase family 2 TIM barrel-domain containing protein [Candidatus Hydrogenedentota bacterium]
MSTAYEKSRKKVVNMGTIDLSRLEWSLRGWRPNFCAQAQGIDTFAGAEVGPFKAYVPGSVQRALLEAGVIPDWRVGVNSRACEWVEHRQWQFTTEIPAGTVPPGETAWLEAQGLDYAGWIYVDSHQAGYFEGTLLPHRFDLTPWLSDGKAHRLHILFEEPPPEQGQCGYTSRSRYFKPRYNYSWDWCPRIVPIGVWDTLVLRTGVTASFELTALRTQLDDDNSTGTLDVVISFSGDPTACQVGVVLRDGSNVLAMHSDKLNCGENRLELQRLTVKPWWPNLHGEPTTYTVECYATDGNGNTLWRESRTVGFRRIDWQPCEGAPEGAEPWVCVVNDKPIFLQGANWVPPLDLYADATEEDYCRLIELYRDMGANVLRVWGGGILEKEIFYTLCDQAGILVWQEFPLSSSGLENYPPEDPCAIETVKTIAASYIRRRAHHPSLLLWCGGNELTSKPPAVVPIDSSHPCIAALRDAVHQLDPGRRFIPTSPSGPRFCADATDYGKGIHHDIHGPWGMGQFANMDEWRSYWAGDDSLFRSEVGMPAAVDEELLRQYAGSVPIWPPETEYWQHTAQWWGQWARYRGVLENLSEKEAIQKYIELTQRDQAEAYEIAARACKNRFPRCGGFIIWMGHDLFPCPANNNVIDFARRPKPAYYALQRVFRE